MNKLMNLVGIRARKACNHKIDSKLKNKILINYAKLLDKEKKSIINQNLKDFKYAKKIGLNENLVNRLLLNGKKIK